MVTYFVPRVYLIVLKVVFVYIQLVFHYYNNCELCKCIVIFFTIYYRLYGARQSNTLFVVILFILLLCLFLHKVIGDQKSLLC